MKWFTCGCCVMGVNHSRLGPWPIFWLSLLKFCPNELICSLGLSLEPLEVLKMIHNMTRLYLLLEDIPFVEKKNEGCVVEPVVVELNLSE